MRRVLKVVESLPMVNSKFGGEEQLVAIEDSDDISFEITSDSQYPRQWRSA